MRLSDRLIKLSQSKYSHFIVAMSKNLFKELFHNYLDAIKYKIEYHNKKVDINKYQQQHNDRVSDLEKVSGTSKEQFNQMKKIDEKYFSYAKPIIFDIPYVPLTYEGMNMDIGMPKIARVDFLESPILPMSQTYFMGGYSNDMYYDPFNLFLDIFGLFAKKAVAGGKDFSTKFSDPLTKKFHKIFVIYYNILLHHTTRKGECIWKLVEGYTKKMNELEKEYKEGTGRFEDYIGEARRKKFKNALEKFSIDGYKELNALAINLQYNCKPSTQG